MVAEDLEVLRLAAQNIFDEYLSETVSTHLETFLDSCCIVSLKRVVFLVQNKYCCSHPLPKQRNVS